MLRARNEVYREVQNTPKTIREEKVPGRRRMQKRLDMTSLQFVWNAVRAKKEKHSTSSILVDLLSKYPKRANKNERKVTKISTHSGFSTSVD